MDPSSTGLELMARKSGSPKKKRKKKKKKVHAQSSAHSDESDDCFVFGCSYVTPEADNNNTQLGGNELKWKRHPLDGMASGLAALMAWKSLEWGPQRDTERERERERE